MIPPSTEHLGDFAAALRPRLDGDLRLDPMTRAIYATDASIFQVQPVGVLIPKTMDDVQAALEVAGECRVPVLPRGAGSSLAGQTVGAALVIDCTKHLDGILEINAEEQWVRVQPGVVLDHLNTVLAPHNLMVGPDPAPSSRATIGGMVGNNSTGTHSILYGNVINHLHAIRALLPDGTYADFDAVDEAGWQSRLKRGGLEGDIYRGIDTLLREKGEIIERDTPKHWRRNSGLRIEYLLDHIHTHLGDVTNTTRNLAHVLCGSEGTLAFSSEIKLGVVPRPKMTALGVVHFHTRDEALRATTTILETKPAAVELFDGVAIEQTRKAPGFAPLLTFLEGDPGAILITEYYGETDKELRSRLEELERVLNRARQGYAIVRAMTPEEKYKVWTVRKEGLGLIMGVKGDYKPLAVIEDASVPVEHLADYIADLDALMTETDTKAAYYAHASAGCLHVRPFFNLKEQREVGKLREISMGSMQLVAKYGGAISSEHGDGLVRGWLNPYFLGPDLCNVYRDIEQIFDPNGLLNPSKVFDTPPISENLRISPTYTTIPMLEELDWSTEGSFAQAVEMCNGNGACRKLQSGTMCPSFMATREEEHTTRGRANALRAAMSGEVPKEEFTSERMYEVMDLCVQCKACKTECPSNVDMAKIKTEWLNKYWEANGLTRRAKLFAHQPQMARRFNGGAKAGFVNWVNRFGPARKIMQKTVGISAKRPLPKFAREPFTKWFASFDWPEEGTPVVLFADTFNNYNHPEVARAAAEFLQRTGHRVIVAEAGACCGRPLISKGLVTEAQAQALRTVDLLYSYAEQGWTIVGLEPSCILTFSDEYLTLLPGDPRTIQVAGATTTFEEYVMRLADGDRLDNVAWKDETRHVLLHGHCHQKALVGTGPSERCLSLPPGYTVETLDTSCCGMAGAFGYEAEHYDISVQMAERRLGPAVRAAAKDTLIAAAGTSCRAQISDTTGRVALHPAEILRNALAEA